MSRVTKDDKEGQNQMLKALGRHVNLATTTALVAPLLATLVAATMAIAWIAPRAAMASASAGAEPVQGPSGLPDARVYEQVSPQNKYGNEAGGSVSGTPPYIVSGIDGDEVAYFNNGPVGETPSGWDFFSIARRTPDGWQSHAAVARGEGTQGAFLTNPEFGLGFSAEMTASVFVANDTFTSEQSRTSPTPHIYRYAEDGELQWIGKPAIKEPLRYAGFYGLGNGGLGRLAGASPGFDTIYYAFEGVLTPAEERPAPALGDVSRLEEMATLNKEASPPASDDGFFEWHEGTLEYAGVLPDGEVDPRGAAPAASVDNLGYSAGSLDNQVSEDGEDAFFVSPDPQSAAGRPIEIYVHETVPGSAPRSVLVSRDLLLAEVDGEPVAAPSGVVEGNGFTDLGGGEGYIYASPDGSHVFFESTDQLTADAPSGTTVKEYDFDTQTQELTYLPGVADSSSTSKVLQSSRDGSDFIFAREGSLDLWNEGTVTQIASAEGSEAGVAFAAASASGSAFVFQSKAPFGEFPFNNGSGADAQVYRYEVESNSLSCLSCPPASEAPTGSASLSNAYAEGNLGNTFADMTGSRSISEDGGRVFFESPDALVSQDTNGQRDVYEWENGTLYLISTGVSSSASYFGDNSQNGDDVFFGTAQGLAVGDTDEAYDVYDARVPRPGDRPPPSAVPCEGSVCQGPPSTPSLLAPPSSETFSGLGDETPSHAGKATNGHSRRKTTVAQRCRKRFPNSSRKRRSCVAAKRNRGSHKSSNKRQRDVVDAGQLGRGN
ncbi:MAG TPA: hypothetical protein VGF95_01400 [Solirubrobacteraceae bacterium]